MPNENAKTDPEIIVTDELDPADVAVITDGLSAYDLSQIGYRDFRRLLWSSAIHKPARSSEGSTDGRNSDSSMSTVVSARGFAPRTDR